MKDAIIRSVRTLVLLLAAGGCATAPKFSRTGAQPADVVIANARIFTSNTNQLYADSLAIRGERIAYVGSREGVADFVGPNTEVIDGRGRLVTPGFVDNHCHALWIGGMTYLQPWELFTLATQDDILAWIKARAENYPDLPLIGGIGWRMDQLPDGPRREILDAVVSDRPVMLMAYSGQGGWLNSKAIELMEARNPEAFERLSPVRDPETGRCTGECLHYHVVNYLDYWTWDELGPTVEQGVMDAMTKTLNEALSYGVTTVHDIQIYPQFIPTILKFRDRGGLDNVRARCAYFIGHERLADEAQLKKDLRDWKKLRETESGPHLVLGESLKFYIDGTGDNRTAFLLEPYSDDPSTRGRPDWTEEEFNRVIEIADKLGLQCCTHACGDAGARRVIDAYERALKTNGMRDARHSIEHCEMPPAEDWPRMARLDIGASMQPQHFFADAMVENGLGFERVSRRMPWRSLDEAGVRVSFGTDWAAGPFNPAYGLLIAALRMNYKGDNSWGPREAVSIEDGIRFWTLGSARNLFMEDEIGSLEVGKYADLVIFNTNLRKMPTLWFLLTHEVGLGTLDRFVDVTMVGGRKVYEKGRPGRERGSLALTPGRRAENREEISARSGTF
ncbi:MAG: amidohydrolase [Kiritimatiellae bacterium]|nr:amidohydrolase [Kiritimatiellia bacterium]